MKCHIVLLGLFSFAILGPCGSAEKVDFDSGIPQVLETIARQEGDARLDYASIDSVSRRLYVARGFGVTAVDLDTGRVVRQLVPGEHVHAVIALPEGRALSTNGDTDTATLFDASSGNVIAQIHTGKDPDAAVYDPSSGLVFVMNGEDGDMTLIDPKVGREVGHLPVGGKLEFAVVDGRGRLFVNIEDRNKLAVIDTGSRKVLTSYALPGCEGPTALSVDSQAGVLVTACSNRTALGLRLADGEIVAAHLAIDRKPDAVIFDAARKSFYIPCGRDGTLIVISETKEAGALTVKGRVHTSIGAHTGALDPKTGRLYVPTADYHLTFSGIKPVDGSFRILVLGFPRS